MSIIEHLEALRRALIIVVIAWGVATIASWFVSGQVVALLLQRAGIGHAIYLALAGGFLIQIKVAIYLGIVLAAPVWIGIERGFCASGTSRTRSTCNRPFSTEAFTALTWSAR